MDSGDALAVVACVGLVVAPVALAGAAGAATGVVPQTEDVDPDGVVMRADVAENGSASWTIEYRIRLDDPNVTEAFEGLQSDVRSNRSAYAGRFERRMNRTVAGSEDATGREMRLANVTVTAERRQLPQSYGVVSYRFEWGGFARVEDERLVVGDALAGLFLDAESRLVIAWPAEYGATSISPGGYEERERAVVWDGPVDFGPDRPRVVLQSGGGAPITALTVVALVLLGGGAAALAYRRREQGAKSGAADETDGATADDAGGDATATPATGEPPEELLSPEERVLRFVRERGGRVKQQAVITQFDWTAARTSQVVGTLRDDGRIETFRLGRENVLTLPDTDITGADEGADGDGGDGEDGEGVDWRPEDRRDG